MKVIFLDFDGVINNWNNDCIVDIENVKYLLEIVKDTRAKIVATTSNKYSFQAYGNSREDSGFNRYVKILNDYGVEIYDITPLVGKNRELEIITYLEMHQDVEEFLILDDDYIMKELREHQVFLDLYNGICEEHVIPSIDILNGKLGFYPKDFNFDESLKDRIVRINEYHSRKR